MIHRLILSDLIQIIGRPVNFFHSNVLIQPTYTSMVVNFHMLVVILFFKLINA